MSDSAAIAAVSARRISGPSETAVQPAAVNDARSSSVQPPSGPISIATVVGRAALGGQRGSERNGGGVFVQHVAIGRSAIASASRRFRGSSISGKMRAARLLAGFERDAPPAFEAFVGRAFQAALAADGLHRDDFRDTQLGGFLDHPFEMIELDQRGAQRSMRAVGLGRGKLFERLERRRAPCARSRSRPDNTLRLSEIS